MPITKFGTGNNSYDFTQSGVYLSKHNSNFGKRTRMSQRMPFMDGSFRSNGTSPSPKEDGELRIDLTLVARSDDEITAKIRAIAAIGGYGLVPLFFQPSDPLEVVQFTYAEAYSVNIPRDFSEHTDLHQAVQIIFHAPDPYWYVPNSGLPEWGIASWGDPWDARQSVAVSGTQTDTVLTNNGNMPTPLGVEVSCGTGESAEDITIQRLKNGVVVDEVSYTATLVASDSLAIRTAEKSVKLNGTNAYSTGFDFKHPRWLILEPGSNDIRIVCTNSSDQATIYFEYFDRYEGSS